MSDEKMLGLPLVVDERVPMPPGWAVVDAVTLSREAVTTVLSDHWQTTEMWGGEQRLACGRCRYGDGVRYLWPCPTRRAITGEAAPDPGLGPVAAVSGYRGTGEDRTDG